MEHILRLVMRLRLARVIITCSHEESDKVHFDLRQYRCIFWDNFNELTEKLTENIVKQGLQAK